jgi:hypothetical protein
VADKLMRLPLTNVADVTSSVTYPANSGTWCCNSLTIEAGFFVG